MNLFGTKKKKEEPKAVKQVDLLESVNRLGNNMNDTQVKLDNTNKELKNALEEYRNARTPMLKQKAKSKATNLLKKKKMYESHMNNMGNTQMNVENAHIQTQMMRDNMDIMHVMKDTLQVQKGIMQDMNVDNVYDLMDDMRDLQDDQNDINEAFSRNYEIDVGDDELDAELDELDHQMRVELDGNELSVPNKRVVSKRENDEKELEDMMK